MKLNKVLGIVFLVLGVLSIVGSVGNGFYASLAEGIGVSETVTLAFQVFFFVGGIFYLTRKKKTEE